MNETEQKLSRYVGHVADGALRFRSELSVGAEAPDFALRFLDGSLFRLSNHRGKSNVVLVFGSFSCGSTITQLRDGNPALAELYRRFKPKVSAQVHRRAGPEAVKMFDAFLRKERRKE